MNSIPQEKRQEIKNRMTEGWQVSERDVEIPFVLGNLPSPPAKLLDVGCADSTFLLEMDRLGFDAWGIDLNDYIIAYDKFVKADARKIPFADKSFDVVTCISALEHYGLVETPYHTDTVYDPDATFTAIREMARVLKDKGIIILTLPYGYGEGDWLKWIKFYNRISVRQLVCADKLFIAKKQIKACIDKVWVDISAAAGEKVLATDIVNCNIALVLKKINVNS